MSPGIQVGIVILTSLICVVLWLLQLMGWI